MQPKRAAERVVLVDDGSGESGATERLADVLAAAGYDVVRTPFGDDGSNDDADLVMHVTAPARARSGILKTDPRDVERGVRAADPVRELEENLHQTQRMESIAQLAAGIAHDFNNILAVISICADEIFETMPAADESQVCVVDIRQAVERGAVLTRDLLSFSRRDVEEPRVVDMNDVITETYPMIERVLGDDIQLHGSLGAASASVRIDPSQWSCVLVNLAINARQAMSKGGTLTIRTRDVDLDPEERGRKKPEGTYLEIEISDTGPGIHPSIQPRIFDPFFTTRGIGKGTGLGLAVVFGVVEQSGGWIEVVSGVDAGATFRIYIPLLEEIPAASSQRPFVATHATVLLVEDQASLRRSAHRALERQGYTVYDAETPEAALRLIEDGVAIDLLVTDERALAAEVTRLWPATAVLFTSKSAGEPTALRKPYTTRQLTARVTDLLSSRR